MEQDLPHGLNRLPPAPEFRRTQDTANTSSVEHIYLYVFDTFSPNLLVNVDAEPLLFLMQCQELLWADYLNRTVFL